MKINEHKIATAAATTMAVMYALYTAIMYYMPSKVMASMLAMHYINAQAMPMAFRVTWQNGLYGLVGHVLFIYSFVWLTAALYNKYE